MAERCTARVEVWARVCGFFRPVSQWNRGKKEEFKDRREFVVGNEPAESGSQSKRTKPGTCAR